ncbi:hypothetical protein ACHAXH_003099 [Discostella pseudostelligera]
MAKLSRQLQLQHAALLHFLLLTQVIEPCIAFCGHHSQPCRSARAVLPPPSTTTILRGVMADSSSNSNNNDADDDDEGMRNHRSTLSTDRGEKSELADRSILFNSYTSSSASVSSSSFSADANGGQSMSPNNESSSIIDDTTNNNSSSLEISSEGEEGPCYLDDHITATDAGPACFVSDSSSLAAASLPSSSSSSLDPTDNSSMFHPSLPFHTRIPPSAVSATLKYLPFITPVIAFSTYEDTARIFNKVVEFISNNNWVAVDGGQYQANIITPAINGLVVPSIALLFATLMSNTINTLRQRQLQIRTSLNTEANDLRMVTTMVDSLPVELRDVKNHLREYLIQYASRVIAESRPGLSVNLQMFIGSMDSEINGFLGVWNKLSMQSYGTMYVDTLLPSSNYTVSQSYFEPYQNRLSLTPRERQTITPFLSPFIFSEVYDGLTRLRRERSMRLSALQSTYPALHYVILSLLGGSICIVFLMETNQELLIFLSAIQLRILWSMLIGTYSALAVVNYDMRDPFRGSYNVAISVDQFYTIRESIMATIQMDQERNTNGSTT